MKTNLFEIKITKGIIDINSIVCRKCSDNTILLSIDCEQKYIHDITFGKEDLGLPLNYDNEIKYAMNFYLDASPDTLNVKSKKLDSTIVTVYVFGNWVATYIGGKYSVTIGLIKPDMNAVLEVATC